MMMTMTRAPGLLRSSAMLLAAALSGGVTWAALPDPTRPPPGMVSLPGPGLVLGITSPVPASLPRVSPPAASASTASTAAPRPPAAPPKVQALLHPDGSPAQASALIDGRLLRIGDRLGDATVQDIRPDGVWLRGPQGSRQWLGLYATTTTTEAPSSSRKEP